MVHHLVAHPVLAAGHQQGRFRQAPRAPALAQARVEVSPRVGELEEEGDVIDAGHAVADLVGGQVEVVGDLGDGVLHRVAEADLPEPREALGQRPGVDRHRVDVLQERRLAAELGHVLRGGPEMGHGAQGPHDAAHAQRVADGLAPTVRPGDLEVDHRRGPIAAHLDGGDDEIGAGERSPAVGRRLDAGGAARPHHRLARDEGRFFEAGLVDVHQGEGGALEDGHGQHVAHDVLHEDRGARADDCDAGGAPAGGPGGRPGGGPAGGPLVGAGGVVGGHFTAPRVRPAMKWRCIRKNIATGGSAATMLPALIRW